VAPLQFYYDCSAGRWVSVAAANRVVGSFPNADARATLKSEQAKPAGLHLLQTRACYSEFLNMAQALHQCCGLPMLQPAAEIGCDP